MKIINLIFILFFTIKNSYSFTLVVKNNKHVNIKTTVFNSNRNLKCFVIEIYDATKSKYVLIRHYFNDTLNKQILPTNNNYNKNEKTIFEQIDFENKIKRKEYNLFESVITFDTLLFFKKSKNYLITGERFFVEFFEKKNEKGEEPFTSFHYLNEKLNVIGFKDSIKGIENQINNFNYFAKMQFGNFLIYKIKDETAYFRATRRAIDAETNYTSLLMFKKKWLTSFLGSYCKKQTIVVLGSDCTSFLWFTKSKDKVKL